jgi:flagellar biosynthesis protein FliR
MSATPLLVFARCAGFVSRAPGISYPGVPPVLRAGIALALTLASLPALRPVTHLDGIALVATLALEFLTGSAIGIGASVVYDGAYAGGRAIDDYVGVKAIAPNVHLVAPSGFGRIWSLAFTGAFFLLGAYRPVIAAFAGSFVRLPPAAPFVAGDWMLAIPTELSRAALGVAGPSIAAGFIVNVALGALSRTIPRFGSLTLSFPIVFGAASIASAVTLAVLLTHQTPPQMPAP